MIEIFLYFVVQIRAYHQQQQTGVDEGESTSLAPNLFSWATVTKMTANAITAATIGMIIIFMYRFLLRRATAK